MTAHDDAAAEFGDTATRPTVDVTGRHLGDYVDEVVACGVATNDPPTLFGHGGGDN